MKDFFISYTQSDRPWAEWIADQLENEGYSTVIQAWDFRPGQNFVSAMKRAAQEATKTVAVLTPAYLASRFSEAEWTAAFAKDPIGEKSLLIPVRVQDFDVDGLLGPLVYIDLVGLNESAARESLLSGVRSQRAKPLSPRPFPRSAVSAHPKYPSTLPKYWNVPHNRNSNFSGRESEIQEIRNALQSGQTSVLSQAITGLGGIGKTQLAVEYAYRYMTDYNGVWWLRAETPTVIASEYAAIAIELGLPQIEVSEMAKVIAAVRLWLGSHRGWLLVFDNASEPKQIAPYLPQAGSHHVIITSRNPNWGEITNPLRLDLWPSKESVAFLLRRTREIDDSSADHVADMLGNLPLALEQAAAYCEVTGTTLSDYSNLLEHGYGAELRKEPKEVDRTIAIVWNMSFLEVEESDQTAAALIKLFAYLAPDNIPLNVIRDGEDYLPESLKGRAINPLVMNGAVANLRHYALADRHGELVSVHRLVQAVTRDRLSEEEGRAWAACAVKLIDNALPEIPYGTYDINTSIIYDKLIPHALTVAQHSENANENTAGYLLVRVAAYLLERGELQQVESFFLKGLEIVKNADDDTTLMKQALAHRGLASLYECQGRFKESLLNINKAIEEITRGDDRTAKELSDCFLIKGMILQHQDDYREAKRAILAALRIIRNVYGELSEQTANAMNLLGECYFECGQYRRAKRFYEKSIIKFEETLNKNSPLYAKALSNQGLLYTYTEGAKKAIETLKRSIMVWERLGIQEHYGHGTALHNLGRAYKISGQYDLAEEAHNKALSVWENELGKDHHVVATGYDNIAELRLMKGQLDDAEKYIKKAKKVRERVFKGDSSEIAISYYMESLLRQAQGDNRASLDAIKKAMAIAGKALGDDHPYMSYLLTQMGLCECAEGNYGVAYDHLQGACAIVKKTMGDSVDRIRILFLLALCALGLRRYGEAEELYVETITRAISSLGSTNSFTERVAADYADFLEIRGREDEACMVREDVVSACDNILEKKTTTAISER